MAKKNVELFHTHIKQEGSEGATRGKIPVAMGRAMGAKDGDVIEWEVVNGDCVGGRVLSKSERREYERGKASAAKSTPPSKKKVKGKVKGTKPVVRSRDEDEDERPSKKGKKKLKKPGKRATKVSYEAPETSKKKGKKKLKLKLKKR